MNDHAAPLAPRGEPPGVHLVASLRSRGAGARGARQIGGGPD